jgi:hypothetical protein
VVTPGGEAALFQSGGGRYLAWGIPQMVFGVLLALVGAFGMIVSLARWISSGSAVAAATVPLGVLYVLLAVFLVHRGRHNVSLANRPPQLRVDAGGIQARMGNRQVAVPWPAVSDAHVVGSGSSAVVAVWPTADWVRAAPRPTPRGRCFRLDTETGRYALFRIRFLRPSTAEQVNAAFAWFADRRSPPPA